MKNKKNKLLISLIILSISSFVVLAKDLKKDHQLLDITKSNRSILSKDIEKKGSAYGRVHKNDSSSIFIKTPDRYISKTTNETKLVSTKTPVYTPVVQTPVYTPVVQTPVYTPVIINKTPVTTFDCKFDIKNGFYNKVSTSGKKHGSAVSGRTAYWNNKAVTVIGEGKRVGSGYVKHVYKNGEFKAGKNKMQEGSWPSVTNYTEICKATVQ